MENRTHKPFTIEMARDLAKDGEELLSKGFVKTEGFDKSVVFLMSLTEEIYRIATKHKSFRMELFYDAETLNTNYCFFTANSDGQGETDQMNQGTEVHDGKEEVMSRERIKKYKEQEERIQGIALQIFEIYRDNHLTLLEAAEVQRHLERIIRNQTRM